GVRAAASAPWLRGWQPRRCPLPSLCLPRSRMRARGRQRAPRRMPSAPRSHVRARSVAAGAGPRAEGQRRAGRQRAVLARSPREGALAARRRRTRAAGRLGELPEPAPGADAIAPGAAAAALPPAPPPTGGSPEPMTCVAGSEGAGGGVTWTDGSEGAGAGTEGTGGGVTWTDGSAGAG